MRYLRLGWLGIGCAVGALCIGLVLVASAEAGTRAKKGDLVVLEQERWLDTLKVTVKNFGKSGARDVTLFVKFLDKRKRPLGSQHVSLGDIGPGDQNSFSIPINEKNRPAKHYQFEFRAVGK
jgi:hypothetical protein